VIKIGGNGKRHRKAEIYGRGGRVLGKRGQGEVSLLRDRQEGLDRFNSAAEQWRKFQSPCDEGRSRSQVWSTIKRVVQGRSHA